MKQCPKCKTEHNKPGTFCSRICANSRIFSEESRLKKSIANKGKPSTKSKLSSEEYEVWCSKIRQTKLQQYLETPFENLGMDNKRRRVLEEQNHCCNKCGINEWQGFKITLELEHKDGNNQNNSRENLEGLCPNCHSITDTWRGRNKPARNGVDEVTDEFLLQCLKETKNIRQGLLKAGMAAKGKNYLRAKRLLESK
jgi:Zn finger protein HypA/HybF involved in hydrogenase expression